jgi:hypothetical protein
MQDQPTPGGEFRSGLDKLERAALGQLLVHHPAIYTLAELALELDEPDVVVEETVAALARAGLERESELISMRTAGCARRSRS